MCSTVSKYEKHKHSGLFENKMTTLQELALANERKRHIYTFSHCKKCKSRQTVVSKALNLSDMYVTSSKLARVPSANMEKVGFMTYMPATTRGQSRCFGRTALLCLAHASFFVLLPLFVSYGPLYVHVVSSLFSLPQIGTLRV